MTLAIDLMRDSGMKFYAKPEGKGCISINNTTTRKLHVATFYLITESRFLLRGMADLQRKNLSGLSCSHG